MSPAWTADILRLQSVPQERTPTLHLPEHHTPQGRRHVCNQLQILDRRTAIAATHTHNSSTKPDITTACHHPVHQSHTRRVVHIPFAQIHRPQKPNAKHYKHCSSSARHTDPKSHVPRPQVAPAHPRHHLSEQSPLQHLVESLSREATAQGPPNQPTASTKVDKKPSTIWRTTERKTRHTIRSRWALCAFMAREVAYVGKGR